MAPKSRSATKPASGSKAKSTSATKIKQELLNGSKPVAVSQALHMKKIKQELLANRKIPAGSSSAKENHNARLKGENHKGGKPAGSSSAKENHNAQLKGENHKGGKPAAENDALRKTLAVKEHHDDTMTTMIPHPDKGVAGSGFNLQEAMGLADDPETYALLRRSVRDLAAKAGIDCAVFWYRQPKDLISKIIGLARQRHTYFKRFPHGWAIEEFLKSNLKNKRAYARKRGYLGDQTNRGVESGERRKLDDDGDESASNSNHSDNSDGNSDQGGTNDSFDDADQGVSGNNSFDDVDQGGNDSDRADDYGCEDI